MDKNELALQLTMAALAGGAVKFTAAYGRDDEYNKVNAEKIIKFYNEMVKAVNTKIPSSEN